MKIKTLGWLPDAPDFRDHLLATPRTVKKLPPKVDLSAQCPPVFDQGQLGSCTANALAAAVQFELAKQGRGTLAAGDALARLFIYYNERVIEHTVASDSGAQLRDGIKALAKQGACKESDWPYDIARFKAKPAAICYKNALGELVKSYQRLTSANSRLACLAAGFPFVLGFTVYESFESEEVARSGEVSMPQPNEQAIGGHAVLCIGYDTATSRFLCRNSWGDWGAGGNFTIPFDYLNSTSLSDDHWVIRA